MSIATNSTIDTDSPPGRQSNAAPMNVSPEHDVIPDIADIRAELHAFAVEMSQEITAIQSLLSALPSHENVSSPSASRVPVTAPDAPISKPQSHESDEDPVEPTEAAEPPPNLNPQPARRGQSQDETLRPKGKPIAEPPSTPAVKESHGHDRLSALKKRLAEKLQAEGLNS